MTTKELIEIQFYFNPELEFRIDVLTVREEVNNYIERIKSYDPTTQLGAMDFVESEIFKMVDARTIDKREVNVIYFNPYGTALIKTFATLDKVEELKAQLISRAVELSKQRLEQAKKAVVKCEEIEAIFTDKTALEIIESKEENEN